jgi:pullulanase/glycogen debranching enzyme
MSSTTTGPRARASINHITVHDGFTLADLFSYNEKHNEANGEDNRDGSNDNHSNNCGHEGPTDDPAIIALRRQLRKNALACLLLAQGTPLILAGDEVANTQGGNNNAYCQDNEISWFDWSWRSDPSAQARTDFVARLIALRRDHRLLRSPDFSTGKASSQATFSTSIGSTRAAKGSPPRIGKTRRDAPWSCDAPDWVKMAASRCSICCSTPLRQA